MPIRPENRHRYPANWKDIVAGIRERSGDRCEGSPRYPDCRAANREPHPVTGSAVVLTTGHLDHIPEHCDPENLRHWCQRCHLTYDAKQHAQTAYMTRRCDRTLDMFTITPEKRSKSDGTGTDHDIASAELTDRHTRGEPIT